VVSTIEHIHKRHRPVCDFNHSSVPLCSIDLNQGRCKRVDYWMCSRVTRHRSPVCRFHPPHRCWRPARGIRQCDCGMCSTAAAVLRHCITYVIFALARDLRFLLHSPESQTLGAGVPCRTRMCWLSASARTAKRSAPQH